MANLEKSDVLYTTQLIYPTQRESFGLVLGYFMT